MFGFFKGAEKSEIVFTKKTSQEKSFCDQTRLKEHFCTVKKPTTMEI